VLQPMKEDTNIPIKVSPKTQVMLKSFNYWPPEVDDGHVICQENCQITEDETGAGHVKKTLLPTDLLHHGHGKDVAEKTSQTWDSDWK
jgi:hypothetical protein